MFTTPIRRVRKKALPRRLGRIAFVAAAVASPVLTMTGSAVAASSAFPATSAVQTANVTDGSKGTYAPATNGAPVVWNPSRATPVSGGTLDFAMPADPLCLDPHQISSDFEQTNGRILFDTLTYLNANKYPVPDLATSWTISPDGKDYTFNLRKGVTFSDGSPFNAQNVIVNFEQMLAPSTLSPLAGPYIAPYKSATIINPYKLVVHLKYRYSPFLYVLAQGWLGMESTPSLQNDTPAQLCTHPIGSGPFVLQSYTQNQGIVYTKRSGYDWAPPILGHNGPAYLSQIDVSFVTQDVVRYNGLISGQYNAEYTVPTEDAASVRANPSIDFVDVNRYGTPSMLNFNMSAGHPFSDIRVREAVVDAIDVPSLVAQTSFGGYLNYTNHYLDKTTPYFDQFAKVHAYDPSLANKLLDEAGWTGRNAAGYRTNSAGKELDLTYPISATPNPSPQYAIEQQDLKAVGINLIVTQYPATQITTMRYDGDYDISGGVWHTNTPDVLYIRFDTASISTPSKPGQNSAYLSDPKLDTLLLQARQTPVTDTHELKVLYDAAQVELVKDVPGLPISENNTLWAFNTNVHNVIQDTSHGTPVFTYAWIG